MLLEHNPDLEVIITGLLPRDLKRDTVRRRKISYTNECLEQYCRPFPNITYMKQDADWILEDGTLDFNYYYADCVHLIESGNQKLAASIHRTVSKVSNNTTQTTSSSHTILPHSSTPIFSTTDFPTITNI